MKLQSACEELDLTRQRLRALQAKLDRYRPALLHSTLTGLLLATRWSIGVVARESHSAECGGNFLNGRP